MKIHTLQARDLGPDAVGRIITANLPVEGAMVLRKGDVMEERHLGPARAAGEREVRLLEVEAGELPQEVASRRLAEALAGEGVAVAGPEEGQMELRATRRGVLRVDVELLDQVNALPDVLAFTLFDSQVVEQGDEVGGAKGSGLVVPERSIAAAEVLCAGRPAVRVLGFRPVRVCVIARERLNERARLRFQKVIGEKIAWYGASLAEVAYLADDPPELADALARMAGDGAGLIVTAGGNYSDPLDAGFQALERLDVRLERLGLPAFPGTMFWIAYISAVPVLGLPGCSTFARTGMADLVMARLIAGEHVTSRDLARLGHGGLFRKYMAFRFPQYDVGDGR